MKQGNEDYKTMKIEIHLIFFSRSENRQWTDYRLPAIKILLAPSLVEKYQSCSLSASNSLLEAFDRRKKYNMTLDLGTRTMAIYTIYKRTTG